MIIVNLSYKIANESNQLKLIFFLSSIMQKRENKYLLIVITWPDLLSEIEEIINSRSRKESLTVHSKYLAFNLTLNVFNVDLQEYKRKQFLM